MSTLSTSPELVRTAPSAATPGAHAPVNAGISVEAIQARWAEHDGPLVITWNAAHVAPEWLLERSDAVIFLQNAQECDVGLGIAREVTFAGSATSLPEARFAAVKAWSQEVLAPCLDVCEPGIEPAEVRAYGGFSFLPGVQLEAPWSRFGQARFVVPRFRYRVTHSGCRLSLYLEPGQQSELPAWLAQAQTLLASLVPEALPESIGVSAGDAAVVNDRETLAWRSKVNSILAGIGRGEWTKVVAARRLQLEFDAPVSLGATFAALAQSYPDCTQFCFRFGSDAFIGATPERLIRKRGREIQTEALAGTFRTNASEFASELLRSPKEHSEHAPVLLQIVEQLQPLCSELHYSSQPELRTLPNLLHLRTPISGVLGRDLHVLDLVALLHPTPAVGGTPTPAALKWIAEREGFQRGWYASPIGWFQGNGDGDFEVGLRSGVISGNSAYLFAGGGIVAGSEAESEYAETQLKLLSLRAALRIRGDASRGGS